jgi:hypothetical protein
MRMRESFATVMLAAAFAASQGAPTAARAEDRRPLDANQIVANVVAADPIGLGGATLTAKLTVTERSGRTRSLAFDAKSRKYAPSLSTSVIAFQSPADVAGMKFLQIQKGDGDDERYLFTPELGRSRRVAGSTRSESFMGTDFSYADLDLRDLRQSHATLRADEVVGRLECYHLDVVPRGADAVYGRIELWVRKDNFVPVRWAMFDKRAAPVRTLAVREMQRLGGRWFVTSSRMTDAVTARSTDLVLERVERRDDLPMEQFSVRAIEKG